MRATISGVPDLERFHEEMATLDGPVVIVTASDGATRAGCLVGFHTQASIEPARYLVALSVKNHTYRVATGSTHLAVHFLGEEHLHVAERFGTTCSIREDKFALLDVTQGAGGAPVLSDCAHWFVGAILGTLVVDDHVVFALEPTTSGGSTRRGRLLGFQAVKHLQAGHPP